jgi:threonine aldolase
VKGKAAGKRSAGNDLEQYRADCTRWLAGHGPRTAAAVLAEIPTDLGIDRYGDGGAVAALEAEVCKVLGKPAAAFMPSGTMAQQIALRIHADRRRSRAVAYHPTCHLELHEDKAHTRLHNLVGVPVGNPRLPLTLDWLKRVQEPLAAVLFELPQREIGGVLPAWGDLKEQIAFARSRGAAVHMDGARLWESTPFYGKTPAKVAAPFDSVYVSFYKGLGGLAGACLAGEEDFIGEARAWRKRHGGTLFGMWPNAASALAGLRQRLPLMPRYVAHARAIAAKLESVPGIEVTPNPPHTQMMHLHLHVDDATLRANACRIARERGVYTFAQSAPGHAPSMRKIEFTVGDATLGFKADEAATILGELVR